MKIDRLIGIITILLQNDKVTAPYLAEKFEVSRRTISRDIDDLCKAGIPVITTQGTNGGISIADGYKIEKTLFTESELKDIFTGLASLDSVTQGKRYQNIIDKFILNKSEILTTNHILIDLSSHYKNTLAPKIADIRQAIEEVHQIEFIYYNQKGERYISLEPYLIVFQWSNWYVFGVDCASQDFRLYKLNRLWNLQITDRPFHMRDIPQKRLDFNGYFTDEIHSVILFDTSVKFRLIEEYGIDSFSVMENGKLRFEFPFTNKEYLFNWILSFGDKAELMQPKSFRVELKELLEKNIELYK